MKQFVDGLEESSVHFHEDEEGTSTKKKECERKKSSYKL